MQSQRIEVIELGVTETKIIGSFLDDQRYGFLIQPNFNKEGVNLRIRFELLLPISEQQYIFCQTITGFFLEYFNADYLKTEIKTLTGLIQVAMSNTRVIVMQKFTKYNYVPMQYFSDIHFEEELRLQIQELEL